MNFAHFYRSSRNGRLLALAMLVLALACVPGLARSADNDKREDRAEQRVKSMHEKLMITAAQEPLWSKVADVMREDARKLDTLASTRTEHAQDRNAVEDLKSYSEITDAHAEGLRRLTAAFTPLYDGMSETQKKAADKLFRGAGKGGMHAVKDK